MSNSLDPDQPDLGPNCMQWLSVDDTCNMRGSRKFVRAGPTLTSVFCFYLVDGVERASKCHLKWVIIGPPAQRHRNGVSLACR